MKQLPGARERSIDVRADVFFAEPVEEPSLAHHEKRLCVRSAQNEMFAAPRETVVQILQSVQTGGVHGQYFPHSQNQNVRFTLEPRQRAFEFVSGAEEKCAENAVH